MSSRAGQANVYVDDTDVGYVVSVASGSTYGSLNYALNNDVGEYVVFSRSLDGEEITIPDESFIISRDINIIGNGISSGTILSTPIQSTKSINISNIESTKPINTGLNLTMNNCYIHDCTGGRVITGNANSYIVVGGGNITQLTGCTFSNINFSDDASNGWGVINTYSSTTSFVRNCIFDRIATTRGVALFTNSNIENTTFMNCGFVTHYNYSITVSGCTFNNTPFSCCTVTGSTHTCTLTNNTFNAGSNIRCDRNTAKIQFSGVNVLNSTVSGAGQIVFADGSTMSGSGTIGRGFDIRNGSTVTFNGITITKTGSNNGGIRIVYNSTVYLNDCLVTNGYIGDYGSGLNLNGDVDRKSVAYLTGSTVTGNTQGLDISLLYNSEVYVIDSTIGQSVFYTPADWHYTALNIIGNVTSVATRTYLGGEEYIRIATGSNLTIRGKMSVVANGNNCMSVGSFGSGYHVYTVGGSASVITSGGQTVSISGIGTYVNADGTNDFTTPYMVVNTSSSGTGSLLYGLVGSTKYVVVNHNVTSCSAVLTTDVNRVINICTGDGRTIVGGSVSIPNGSTVSVNTVTDSHGAAQVTGSTVTVTGGSTTLSGNCIVGGVVSPTGGLNLVSGTTVSGAGAGANITGMTITTSIYVGDRTVTLQNLTIDSPRNVSTSSAQSTGAIYVGGTWLIKNCKIFNVQSKMTTGFVFGNANVVIEGSTCTGDPFVYIQNSGNLITLRNSTVSTAATYTNASVRIEGNCTILSRVGKINGDEGSDRLILADGATVNIASANRTDPMWSNAIVCEGTATIIYAGGTKKVKDTGTYFNKNGSTNLTVVS